MTSQRDETVGHVAGDEMTDDPIVVERHDEILGGPPADDPEAEDASGPRPGADDGTPAGDELAPAVASEEGTTGPRRSATSWPPPHLTTEPPSDEPGQR